MRPVAVIGPAQPPKGVSIQAFEAMCRTAFLLGRALACRHYPIICGGRPKGVMQAVAAGCCGAGGICIGILPRLTDDATPGVIVMATDLGNADEPIAKEKDISRNRVLVRAALCVFAVGGGPGTADELRFAWEDKKRVFGLNDPPNPKNYEKEIVWDVPDGPFSKHVDLDDALNAFQNWVQSRGPFELAGWKSVT